MPKIVVQYTTAFGKVFITPHLLSIIILYLCPHKINSYLLSLISYLNENVFNIRY
ncbi:hypothetical protein HMPREF9073_02027 [Capnocytophaga sp. oral taxon 326 str. F0382]|nr:hypothetical protein HMPREF9073_02027 [Capnocytophaga sp. oral taxon 326 str. F0382]